MTARATLRLGWQVLYRHLTQVETDNKPFVWQRTYLHTLQALRSSALRAAHTHRVNVANKKWTSTKPQPLNKALDTLIDIDPDGHTPPKLSQTLTTAIEEAIDALDKHAQKT